MRSRIAWTIVLLVVVLLVIALTHFNLTALQEPSGLETRITHRATRFLIGRASRQGIPPRLPAAKAGIGNGIRYYGPDCSFCHGTDGHAQTVSGRWMYPRAADLASAQVQSYSDSELFW